MNPVRLCLVQVGPAQKTARPISLPRLVVADELMIVNGAVGFVDHVGAGWSSVIVQT
jgi:hypothetical protein